MSGIRFTDIRRFDSVDSTNRYLLDVARSGGPEGVVAVADFQTAGRGRLDRRWEAPAGSNLLVSVLLRPDLRPEERHLAAGAVALAAVEAAERVAGVSLDIKWPNDLLGPDGRKVAGVLTESDTGGPGGSPPTGAPPALVVGLGMNVNWPGSDDDLPPELAGTAGSLRRIVGRSLDRAELLGALLDGLGPWAESLRSREGRALLTETVRSRCATIGAAVRVELADGAFEGRAVDLTAEGHLVVETVDGRRTVLAGDVVHLRTRAGNTSPTGPRPGRL